MTAWDDWLAGRAVEREQRGLVRRLDVTDPTGGRLLDLAGNDYLGLVRDPRVVEGAVRAVRQYGGGAGASRLVTGTLPIHAELEQRLAEFTGSESALVCSTGYQANLAVVTALVGRGSDVLVVSDAHVHASLIDACRLARAPVQVTPHNDVPVVQAALAGRSQPRALVLVESIYSVLGDAAPLADLLSVCAAHDALLVVDEAHAIGVAGPGGRGCLAALGAGRDSHVVATVTLSKALASQGGAVLGPFAVREHLVNTARPFIYDTGLAPAAAGAALAALDVVTAEPERADRLHRNAAVLAAACGVAAPPGAVLSVPVGGPLEALAAVETAASKGVRIGCFRPPSTPDGTSRLRLTAHADHTVDDLAMADEVLRSVLSR